MNKTTLISIFIATALIIGAIVLVPRDNTPTDNQTSAERDNVSITDGKQIVEITARGGYFPRVTAAKADMPTIIRMKTSSTFDCSAALVIPKIGYRNNLPLNGFIDIPLDPQKSGTEITGLCAMGMYNFTIRFE